MTFLLILYELGIVGILLFLSIIFLTLRNNYSAIHEKRSIYNYAAIISTMGLLTNMIFMNYYSTLFFWSIIGLCYVTAQTENIQINTLFQKD